MGGITAAAWQIFVIWQNKRSEFLEHVSTVVMQRGLLRVFAITCHCLYFGTTRSCAGGARHVASKNPGFCHLRRDVWRERRSAVARRQMAEGSQADRPARGSAAAQLTAQ